MPFILIVDDEQQVREMLREMLERAGYNVLEAGHGAAALMIYDKERPDLVVTDILMPHTDGLAVIRELRRQFSEVKILAYSGGGRSGPEDYLRWAKKFGAQRTLAKPFAREEMLRTVRELVTK